MVLQTLRASSLSLTRQFHCPLSISSQRYRNVTHLASFTGTHHHSDDGPPTSALYPRTRTVNTTNPTHNPTITATTADHPSSTPAAPANKPTNKHHPNNNMH